MAAILVVDDSAVDQRLIGGFLHKDADLSVSYANSGDEALEMMGQSSFDLVLTDLVMPKMNGFELVSAVMTQHPLVPVILVTSRGSEEIAVQALEKGAASYVPKRVLSQGLLDTIYRVLAVSDQRRSRAKLLEGMKHFVCAFVIENQSTLIAPLVGYLQDNLTHMGLATETDRIRIGVALQEALVNALYHGNLEIGSELREADPKRYCELIEERLHQMPYEARTITLEARLSRDEATFVIRDEGPGFDVSKVPDPTDPCNLEKASGRGLLLMRTFMDGVTYNDSGNEVTLVKRLAAECVGAS
jgi:CheY-like chemotaxis protein